MDELVRSVLVADVNGLSQSEGAAISTAWYQGSLDYKAKQKKQAGEVGVRGKVERAETTGQSVSGKTVPANKRASAVQNAENDIKTAENAADELHSSKKSDTISRDVAILDSYGVSDNGKRAFLQYKSSESYKINAKLRDGLELSKADIQLVRGMDEALSKLPRYEGTIFREIGFDYEEDFNAFMLGYENGSISWFHAFTSASTQEGAYSTSMPYKVQMVIQTKNGRDATDLGIHAEKEVILPRDTAVWIKTVTISKNKVRIVAQEVTVNEGQSRREQIHDEPGERSDTVRDMSKLSQDGQTGVADVQGVSKRDTGRHSGGVSRSREGVSGGQRGKVRPQGSRTSDVGSIRGETEVLKPGVETEKRDPDGKQYSLTDTATPRRQYKAKRTPTANSEATVSESKADKPRSEAAKPKSAEAAVETGADVKTEAGDGNKAISMQDVIDKIQDDFGVQITRGYMRDVPNQASGRYDTADKGVRYRTANDVNTVSHELGHALDDRYHVLTEDADLAVLKWFANTLPADRIVAYSAAYGLSGEGADFYLPLAKEGLADRLADYLTDAESALKKYPKFKEYFLDPIREKKGGKADLARLERYAEMVHEAVIHGHRPQNNW